MCRKSIWFSLLIPMIGLFALQGCGSSYEPHDQGRLLWHYKPAGSDAFDWCQPAIVYNEDTGQRVIIFGDGDEVGAGRLYAVDADTHKAVWGPVSFDGSIGNSTTTLSSDGKRTYLGESSKPGKVYCVDTSNGHIIWIASGLPSDAGAFMSCGALSHDDAHSTSGRVPGRRIKVLLTTGSMLSIRQPAGLGGFSSQKHILLKVKVVIRTTVLFSATLPFSPMVGL